PETWARISMVCFACVMPVNSSYSVTLRVIGSLTRTAAGFIACFCCPAAGVASLPQPKERSGRNRAGRNHRALRMDRPPFKTILTGQYLYQRKRRQCQVDLRAFDCPMMGTSYVSNDRREEENCDMALAQVRCWPLHFGPPRESHQERQP